MKNQRGSRTNRWLGRIEIFFSITFLVSIVLRMSYLPGSLPALSASILVLAALYFILVYIPAPHTVSSIWLIIFSKEVQIASFITIIGLLFMYLELRGYGEILMTGVISITTGCLCFLISGFKNFDRIKPFRFDIVRGLALILLALTLLIEKNT